MIGKKTVGIQLAQGFDRLLMVSGQVQFFNRNRGQQALNRVLEHGPGTHDFLQLFWALFAAFGPKAGAASSGQYNSVHRIVLSFFLIVEVISARVSRTKLGFVE
jgi:hypothetical protein